MFGCWACRRPGCPGATLGRLEWGRDAAVLRLGRDTPHADWSQVPQPLRAAIRSILAKDVASTAAAAKPAGLAPSVLVRHTCRAPLLLARPRLPHWTGVQFTLPAAPRPASEAHFCSPGAPGAPSGPAQPADYRLRDLQAHKPVCGPPGNPAPVAAATAAWSPPATPLPLHLQAGGRPTCSLWWSTWYRQPRWAGGRHPRSCCAHTTQLWRAAIAGARSASRAWPSCRLGLC